MVGNKSLLSNSSAKRLPAADEYNLITLGPPGAPEGVVLACWHAYDRASKVELHSTALGLGARWFFVDPIPLRPAILEELLAAAAPAGIILTNANHARAAEEFRQRFSIPVHAHVDALEEIGLTVDKVIPAGGGLLGDGLEAWPVAGAVAGEIALYHGGGGVCVIGDALIDLPGYGLTFLPPKYCANARQLRQSLHGLLAKPFEVMMLAHGEPIVTGARARLAALLEGATP